MENITKQKTGLIFIDCEMGSVELDYSLLSSYFFATDDNFQRIDELELLVKPDDNRYIVCGEAMNVNKINLRVHDTKAIPYKTAGTTLYNWLDRLTDRGRVKFTPVGHGIYGDIKFIQKYLISRGSWEKFISYRVLDTSAVVQFLKTCGKFPEDVSGSLGSLAKYFSVPYDENLAHSAEYDVKLLFGVFQGLRKLIMA